MNGIIAFLEVAENPGINMLKLSTLCDLSMATASRVARALGPAGIEGSLPPYFGLIDIFVPLDNPRGRALFVSARGREICLELDAIIEAANTIAQDGNRCAG